MSACSASTKIDAGWGKRRENHTREAHYIPPCQQQIPRSPQWEREKNPPPTTHATGFCGDEMSHWIFFFDDDLVPTRLSPLSSPVRTDPVVSERLISTQKASLLSSLRCAPTDLDLHTHIDFVKSRGVVLYTHDFASLALILVLVLIRAVGREEIGAILPAAPSFPPSSPSLRTSVLYVAASSFRSFQSQHSLQCHLFSSCL